jgi:putative inorganic carbon (HCO3(-)) transporter
MRDLLVIAIVALGCMAALRRPWIGVILWTWLSILNPHRFSWGMAYEAPLAAAAAIATVVGLAIARDRASPFKGPAVVAFALFTLWLTVSWVLGLDPAGDFEQWKKVIKVNFMILVGLALMHSKQHVFALAWVVAGSLALLGVKGGLFTLLSGGQYRVYGPPGSFIEDNNEFALALVMTIPLLRFLQLQLQRRWARLAMTAAMLLCAAAILGTHSRGSFLGICAMLLFLWWHGKSRWVGGALIAVGAVVLLGFMPEAWMERMRSIEAYEQDSSALGRISAWWNAWGIAQHYPFGVGMDAARPALFAQFSPYPDRVHAAHSIYFQVLGNHGFVGLALFLAIWIYTYRSARWLRLNAGSTPQAMWCAELGAMCQVALIGYAVGGAFLSLSYFDLPYNLMMLIVITRKWVESRGWEREPAYRPGWRMIPGLSHSASKAG